MKTRFLNNRNSMRWGAVAGAIGSALVAWTGISPVGGTELTVPIGGVVNTIGAGHVLAVALVSGLAAVGTASLIERRVQRPRRTWMILATGVFAVSLLGPISTGAALPIVMSLVALHSVVAVVLIPQIRWTLKRGNLPERIEV